MGFGMLSLRSDEIEVRHCAGCVGVLWFLRASGECALGSGAGIYRVITLLLNGKM
jgi:hypothetical protein